MNLVGIACWASFTVWQSIADRPLGSYEFAPDPLERFGEFYVSGGRKERFVAKKQHADRA